MRRDDVQPQFAGVDLLRWYLHRGHPAGAAQRVIGLIANVADDMGGLFTRRRRDRRERAGDPGIERAAVGFGEVQRGDRQLERRILERARFLFLRPARINAGGRWRLRLGRRRRDLLA
jgi:hypothetical protein